MKKKYKPKNKNVLKLQAYLKKIEDGKYKRLG